MIELLTILKELFQALWRDFEETAYEALLAFQDKNPPNPWFIIPAILGMIGVVGGIVLITSVKLELYINWPPQAINVSPVLAMIEFAATLYCIFRCPSLNELGLSDEV